MINIILHVEIPWSVWIKHQELMSDGPAVGISEIESMTDTVLTPRGFWRRIPPSEWTH